MKKRSSRIGGARRPRYCSSGSSSKSSSSGSSSSSDYTRFSSGSKSRSITGGRGLVMRRRGKDR